MNKRGAIDEGLMMIYRLLLISFIAFVILGVSSIFYAHYVDVRDAEARILAQELIDCVSPSGVLDLSSFSEEDYGDVLVSCGYDIDETERFYVEVDVNWDDSGVKFFQGDSGELWVLEIFKSKTLSEGLEKYHPGYYFGEYPVYVLREGNKIEGKASVQVLVKDEF